MTISLSFLERNPSYRVFLEGMPIAGLLWKYEIFNFLKREKQNIAEESRKLSKEFLSLKKYICMYVYVEKLHRVFPQEKALNEGFSLQKNLYR